jgi:hypothetical protein
MVKTVGTLKNDDKCNLRASKKTYLLTIDLTRLVKSLQLKMEVTNRLETLPRVLNNSLLRMVSIAPLRARNLVNNAS